MFEAAGLESVFKKEYDSTHIILEFKKENESFFFKNNTRNTTMFSGYNSVLLNVFQEKGISDLKKVTPIIMLKDLLSKDRYKILEDAVKL